MWKKYLLNWSKTGKKRTVQVFQGRRRDAVTVNDVLSLICSKTYNYYKWFFFFFIKRICFTEI